MSESMGFRELGSTGVLVSEIGIGTWDFHGGADLLRRGIEAGASFIDTAESYGNEAVIGLAVKGVRDKVFVATKVSPQHFRYSGVIKSAESSLNKLGIDHIDLYQLHEPSELIPIEETMAAMGKLVDTGKVRFIGVSNFSVRQLEQAQRALSKHRIVSNQVRYSLIDRTIEASLLQYCWANQITVIAYSPLGRQFGRMLDCDPDGVIEQLARIRGKSPAQIVLNWCLCKDGVVAIPKSNSAEHILENCAASGWRLTSQQLALLDSRIRFRRRNRFDMFLRRYTPSFARAVAARAVNGLPPRLRRLIH